MNADFPLFDAHFHIIDPNFPLIENQGYMPNFFTCDDYWVRLKNYDLRGGAIVSGSFQGFDQSYLLAALHRLGRGFVGVTQVPNDISETDLQHLHHSGVRAVRFNLMRGAVFDKPDLMYLAQRVYDLWGWHSEFYIPSSLLDDFFDVLVKLPAVSIDHMGLEHAGFNTVLKLLENGVRVKLSGFGRLDFDVPTALQRLYAVNPKALMFGTDLPSTRAPRAYEDADFSLVLDTLGEAAAKQVFYDNAVAWYRVSHQLSPEFGGYKGSEPTRFGDWEKNGRCIDF